MSNFDKQINDIVNKWDDNKNQSLANTGKPVMVSNNEPASLKNLPINYATVHDTFQGKNLELGNERLVLGDFENDGYKMIYANLKSGQDAFGVSPDRKTFCVSDGMGAEGAYSGDVSRYLSYELTKDNASWEQAFQEGGLESLVKSFIDAWKKKNSDKDANDLSGHTTISLCRINNDGSAKILQLGDSPVYVKTKSGDLQSYGNDSLNNTSTGIYLGVTNGDLKTNFNLENSTHMVADADSVTLASDWMSDNYESLTKDNVSKILSKN